MRFITLLMNLLYYCLIFVELIGLFYMKVKIIFKALWIISFIVKIIHFFLTVMNIRRASFRSIFMILICLCLVLLFIMLFNLLISYWFIRSFWIFVIWCVIVNVLFIIVIYWIIIVSLLIKLTFYYLILI